MEFISAYLAYCAKPSAQTYYPLPFCTQDLLKLGNKHFGWVFDDIEQYANNGVLTSRRRSWNFFKSKDKINFLIVTIEMPLRYRRADEAECV